MKKSLIILFAVCFTAALISCNEDDDTCVETTWYQDADLDGMGNADSVLMACDKPTGYVDNGNDNNDALTNGQGSVTVLFDNVVGEEELTLEPSSSSDDFPYTNSVSQTFNLDLLGYYITEITLIGMDDTEDYIDQVEVSAENAKGVYHVLESETSSQMIVFDNVPDGIYNQVSFTVGVPGDIVEEGALGGTLDPSQGAWFWNWNVGYVALMMEGSSPSSGQQDSDEFAFHLGGWGEPNNIKEITLDLPLHLEVESGSASMAHIKMDVLKVISGSTDVNFESMFAVHSPSAGEPIADNLTNAFGVYHVEND